MCGEVYCIYDSKNEPIIILYNYVLLDLLYIYIYVYVITVIISVSRSTYKFIYIYICDYFFRINYK